jgi:methylated-DNA-[protein]-cysteine S-methyltransferase
VEGVAVSANPETAATYWCEVESPIGALLLAGDERALKIVHFQAGPRPLRPPRAWHADGAPLREAVQQLAEYFTGVRRTFSVPLAPAGTSFQLKVWEALRDIPYGETLTYGELARRLGSAHGARAVGLANGSNPLPVIVPCHRVIGADGSLTGFGGGLPIKRALLQLEGAACVRDLFSTQDGAATARGHSGMRALR